MAEKSSKKDPISVHMRRRVPSPGGEKDWVVSCETQKWEPRETAVIVCDMWNAHWCRGATSRVVEMAPRVDEFVRKARKRGVFVIHAPSDCMETYKDHPAYQRALRAPRAKNLPDGILNGCGSMGPEEDADYPIDQSDGGCDCEPVCPQGSPWTAQIDAIHIDEKRDAITASGVHVWNLMEERGIQNVMILGVHTNMCVSGRPFGLRNMARFGKRVVLVRDLTDTMYNSRSRPYVDHFVGTDLIVEHIERYICPTVLSSDLTQKPSFRFAADSRPEAPSEKNDCQAGPVHPIREE